MLKFFIEWGNVMYDKRPLLLMWMAGNWGVTKLIRHWFHGGWPDAKTPVVAPESFVLAGWAMFFGACLVVALRSRKNVPISEVLKRRDFPRGFSALEMLWPKRLREEVWHPAFYDEQALYFELRGHAWLPMLNVIFALKVLYLVVVTGRIALLDWSLSRLTNKRSRLTGKAVRRKGKMD